MTSHRRNLLQAERYGKASVKIKDQSLISNNAFCIILELLHLLRKNPLITGALDKFWCQSDVISRRGYELKVWQIFGIPPGNNTIFTSISVRSFEFIMNPKEISGNRVSYMKFLGLKEDNLSDKFPSFYWTPKLHKTPYKDRFIASSFDCTTKPLSVLLTRILSALKKLSNLSSVTYIPAGINEMWILKNSSELLQKIYSFHYQKITSIQTFDFLTLYTPILYQKLKDRILMLVNQTFLYKNGSRRYKHFVVNGERTFFTNEETSADKRYDWTLICQMIDFLIDKIYIKIGNHLFRQCIGILNWLIYFYTHMRLNLWSMKKSNEKLAKAFNLISRYIDDLISINNPRFNQFFKDIYPEELGEMLCHT